MTNPEVPDVIGRTAVDRDGDKIGKIGQLYVDDVSGAPQWVTVSTGLFGTKESFAPFYGAQPDGDDVRLAVTKAQVKDAPNIDADGQLDDADGMALYRYYSADAGPSETAPNVEPTPVADAGSVESQGAGSADADFAPSGHDMSGPDTDAAMTRSEERLHVATEQVETGRARLRKYVVTEDVTQTVPVSHEEVRVEREPITDANRDAALSGAEISEEEHEVTLHAEQPVVSKETVPVERVSLGTETVTEEQTVSEQVRKEQIDTDLDDDAARR